MRLLHVIMALVAVSPAFGQEYWIPLEKPTTRNLTRVFFIDTVQGWVVGDSGTIFKTTNGGTTWVTQVSGISNAIHSVFMASQSFGWALAFEYPLDTLWYGTIMLRTTDGGTTWVRQEHPEEFYYTVSFHDSVNGWLGGTRGKLMRTTDGGLTWSPAVVDSSIASGFAIHNLRFYSRNYGFAVGGQLDLAGIVWRTTNGGERWSANAHSSEPVNDLHYIDSLNLLAVGGEFDIGASMIRSSDGGGRWDYTYLGVWGDARAIAFRTPAEGWVPLGFTGTYIVTRDTGNTWAEFYSPDSTPVYDVTFIDSTHGFMVGDEGTILKFNSSLVSVDSHPVEFPAVPTLYQNYPNPFNPVTTITYALSERTFVVVRLYDATGREVKRVFAGTQDAGVHALEFNGEVLASGTYFYELTTTHAGYRTTQVKKMILLR
ncbi:MAG: hypothetical protein HW412_1322 [Bacteroidetes bacterium]|jgi:photosystem II stability/assembly factor-like uncharacterized protein|nr:hypothetical protein [Bacteroidota bacterium]